MKKVIAVDPGVTTGFCYANIYPEHQAQLVPVVEYFPFQMVDDVDEFWDRLAGFVPDYIIMEDFQFRRGKSATGGVNLFPVQLIGVARLYELRRKGSTRLFLQSPAQGKSYYTDAVLKQRKLYKRGIGHGMDASRHLLQWLTFGYGNQYVGTNPDFATLLDEWERNG